MCARRTAARFLFLLPLVLLTVPGIVARGQVDLSNAASQVAAAIRKSSKDLPTQTARVLVIDFEGREGPASELDHELAQEFSNFLQQRADGFVLLNRDDLSQALSRHNLPEETLSNSAALKCYAQDLGADVVVAGSMEFAPDGVVLQLDAWLTNPRSYIFGAKIVVPMTASMTSLASKHVPEPPPFFTHPKETWVSPSHPPLSDDQVVKKETAGKGYKYPECLFCPAASYTDDAVFVQLQGTVSLRVQILAEGFPAKISVVNGIPCGLTESAIDAVKHWRFKAATVDDRPVAVETPIEVTFHLY